MYHHCIVPRAKVLRARTVRVSVGKVAWLRFCALRSFLSVLYRCLLKMAYREVEDASESRPLIVQRKRPSQFINPIFLRWNGLLWLLFWSFGHARIALASKAPWHKEWTERNGSRGTGFNSPQFLPCQSTPLAFFSPQSPIHGEMWTWGEEKKV